MPEPYGEAFVFGDEAPCSLFEVVGHEVPVAGSGGDDVGVGECGRGGVVDLAGKLAVKVEVGGNAGVGLPCFVVGWQGLVFVAAGVGCAFDVVGPVEEFHTGDFGLQEGVGDAGVGVGVDAGDFDRGVGFEFAALDFLEGGDDVGAGGWGEVVAGDRFGFAFGFCSKGGDGVLAVGEQDEPGDKVGAGCSGCAHLWGVRFICMLLVRCEQVRVMPACSGERLRSSPHRIFYFSPSCTTSSVLPLA